MHTWNVIFGFSSLEPSLKQEMRLMNMLVFPGTDMLQKLLIQESIVEENPSTGSGFCLEGAKRTDCRSTEFSSPKIDTETSSGHEPRSCDDTEQHHFKAKTNEVAVTNPNPESVSVSLNDTSTANSPLDAFCEAKMPCSPMQTVTLDSDSDDKPGIRHGLEDRSQSTSQCMAADTSLNNFLEPKVKVSNEGIICSNAHAGHKLADSVYVRKSFSPTTGNGTFELENVPSIMDSPEDDAHANSLKPTRPFETTSDCKNAIAYVKEAISDGICGSENSPQSCGAKARGGLQEERAESGSV